MKTAYFNRFSIDMTLKQAESASHQGQCYDDVVVLCEVPEIKAQLAGIADDDLARELAEYGAWDEEELASRADNELRIIWIAAGNIVDDIEGEG